MNRSKEQVLAWESRWAIPVAVMTLLAVAALIGGRGISNSVSGDGTAEILRSVHAHSSSETLAGIVQAFGFALFAAPLFYLFRADQARSSRVRNQFVGLVLVAPLFMAASTVLGATARNEGATEFVAGNAKSTLSPKEANEECASQRKDEGAKEFGEEFEPRKGETALKACETQEIEDDEASNAVTESSTIAASTGFGIAGGLGIAVAFFYTCLWALRTGLMSRFWASFGMATGIATLIGFLPLPIIFFAYFALLLPGWLPGGKPPAWAEGEAVPWPTPGEKVATELEPADSSSERRKRKQRS